MHVTLLGTMGWMPSDRRETTCMACRSADHLLVFDAGTGLRRLLDPAHAALVDGARDVHLFLSHYHLDHVCGLAYLSGVFPDVDVVLHPPEQAITGIDPETALAGLLRKPYSPVGWEHLKRLRLEPLRAGPNSVAGHTIRLRPQKHSDVSVSFRIDDEFVLATDTGADPAASEFSAGVGLLIHEAWYWAADPGLSRVPEALRAGYAAHSEAGAVAALAAAADVGRLVLVHLNPLAGEKSFEGLQAAAGAVFARTEVRDDGTVLATSAH